MKDNRSLLKRAELLSTIGAAVLGGGIALILQRWLSPLAVSIAIAGLLVHAWGMLDKHRIESGTSVERAPWEDWLYWLCWIVLGVLFGYLIIDVLL